MRWIWLAMACVATIRVAHAECVEAPGSKREIELVSGWKAEAHAVFAEGDAYVDPSGTVGVVVIPPISGACATMGLRIEGGKDMVEGGPRPALFSPRWTKYWVKSADGDLAFTACKDTVRGAVEVKVVISEGSDVTPRDPSLLAMTDAVADSLDFDIQCHWEPKAPAPQPVVYEDEHGDGTAMAGFAMVFDSGNDFEQVVDLRVGLLGRQGRLLYTSAGRFGLGTTGGVLWDLTLGAGFSFGSKTKVDILAVVGGRGVSGDRVHEHLGGGLQIAVHVPLTNKLTLVTRATPQYMARFETTMMNGMETTEITPVVQPELSVVVATKWLAAGLAGGKFGQTIMVGATLGLFHQY